MESETRLPRFESYLPFTGCVLLVKLCNLSVPPFINFLICNMGMKKKLYCYYKD